MRKFNLFLCIAVVVCLCFACVSCANTDSPSSSASGKTSTGSKTTAKAKTTVPKTTSPATTAPKTPGEPTPVPTKAPVFSSDFSNAASTEWETFGGEWAIVNGEYTVKNHSGAKSMLKSSSYTDFTCEVDVTLGAGGTDGNAGIVFRVNNAGEGTDEYDGYYVGLTANAVVLGTCFSDGANGIWTGLDNQPVEVGINKKTKLKVVVTGESIEVYVNDELYIDAEHSDHADGEIGFRTFMIDASFDNMKVTPA